MIVGFLQSWFHLGGNGYETFFRSRASQIGKEGGDHQDILEETAT